MSLLPGVDIKVTFEAMGAQTAVTKFLESGLLTNSVQWSLRFVILAGLRLEADGDDLDTLLANRLKEFSVVRSHRPQAATIRRVEAACQLLRDWDGRRLSDHNISTPK